jgi:hypothetical protein
MTTRHYYRCHRSPRHRGARLLMVILSGFAISCFTADLLAALATGNPARLALQPAEAPPAIAEVVDPEPEKEKEGCHPPPGFFRARCRVDPRGHCINPADSGIPSIPDGLTLLSTCRSPPFPAKRPYIR